MVRGLVAGAGFSSWQVDTGVYNIANRLISVVIKDKFGAVIQTVSYEYDVNDLRVKKTVDGVVENYYLDRDNIAFVTYGVGDRTFHYMYGLEADQVLAQDSETGMVWSLADRLGSIDVLVNEQGMIVDQRTYDSFGNTLSQLDSNVKFRFGYTGRESDPETGLYYYRARYFDANVGRFISTDPIGFEAGDANLYRYVNNSPTLATDPTGEWINIAVGAVVGGLIGFGISTARQFAKISDGGSFDINEVLTATAFGAVGGAVVGANPLLAAPLALFGAAQGGISAVNEYSQKHYTTALFDAVTSVFSFGAYKGGGGGFGGQFAFAGGEVGSAVGVGAVSYAGAGGAGAAIGAIENNIEKLFKPYFASDNGSNEVNNNDSTSTNANHEARMEAYKRLRSKTPSQAIRDHINQGSEKKKDPIYGYDVDKYEADHLTSLNDIIDMPGFLNLTPEEQLSIVNDSNNFMGLGKSTNASKQDKTYKDWIGHKKLGPIPDDVRNDMISRENASRSYLENEIQKKLNDSR